MEHPLFKLNIMNWLLKVYDSYLVFNLLYIHFFKVQHKKQSFSHAENLNIKI